MQAHITLSTNASHNFLIRDSLAKVEEGLDRLKSTVATLVLMIDGDSAQDASYAYLKGKVGADSDANAHAAFAELDTLKNALVGIEATIRQACNKLR